MGGGVIREAKRRLLIRMGVRANVTLGPGVHVGPFSVVSSEGHLTIGANSYIGKFCTLQVSGEIGRGVLIANHVGIVGRRDHGFRPEGTMLRDAPWVGSDAGLRDDPANRIRIGDDVWIGYGATILSGIEIGRGAIISAGSVVRADVAPYAIVVGNPARQVGQRFTGDAIAAHDAALAKRYGRAGP